MNESGNKTENKVDILEALAQYKATRLTALLNIVSQQKSKANSLLDNLKDKKELLRVQKEEEQKKAEMADASEVETIADVAATPVSSIVEETKADVSIETPTVVEEKPTAIVQPVNESSAKEDIQEAPANTSRVVESAEVVAEIKKAPIKKEKVEKKSAKDSKPTKENKQKDIKADTSSEKKEAKIINRDPETHTAELKGPNGEIRRIYIPPEKTKPEKKPTGSGVQTRVFANGYQRDRQPNRQGPGAGQGNTRPFGTQPRFSNFQSNLSNMPPVMPTTKGKGGRKQSQNQNQGDDRRGSMNKRQLLKRGYIVDSTLEDYEDDGRIRTKKQKKGGGYEMVDVQIDQVVITTPTISIKLLSEKIGKTAGEIIRQLFVLEIIKTINDIVDFDTAKLVASELGVELEYKPDKTFEDTLSEQSLTDDVDDLENLQPRPPVITIMGHVDHGKTSLLDYIRKAKVASGEAGGITQHIGAYTVKLKGQSITFLDTPGHEAFTAMRARGAQVTDIAVIVVAADDGIMPQTIEAIDHARSANVSIIIAINKIDKQHTDPDRVLQQLSQQNVLAEEWGGDVPVVRVSAKTGQGVDELLENILLLAEVKELKANPDRSAKGTIVEARLDKGKGPVATILVETGTLKIGDAVIAGISTGRIRSMSNDKGLNVTFAGPSTPVAVTGFDEVPNAGDIIMAVEDDKFAKQLAQERQLKLASGENNLAHGMSLDDLFSNIKSGKLKELTLIVKADVQGSLEAVKQSLLKLGNNEVKIKIIHGGVGGIKESDVMLANSTQSIIIGFNVRPDNNAKALAAQNNIDIRCYRIIYDAIEDIENAVKGMLDPQFKEKVLGTAEVRELFKITGVGTIAGSHVTDGKIVRSANVRIVRDGTIVHEGTISSLRHEKSDVKEIAKNYDCGIGVSNYNDVKTGDVFEAYIMEQIK